MANVSEKMKEARLRWLGHVERNTEEDVVMRGVSEWDPKDRKTKTEVKRCYFKKTWTNDQRNP